MIRSRMKPGDYEFNSDYLEDQGIEIEDPDRLYECNLCQRGDHEGCQEAAVSFCRCFYNDHEEAW